MSNMSSTQIYRFISLNIWGNFPSQLQRALSKAYSNIYNKPFSKFIIKPYCDLNYQDEQYLSQFESASGSESYSSFQDFFTRVFKQKPQIEGDYGWPCEGLLCDYGRVNELPEINVKGDIRNIKTIFGVEGQHIPDDYYFSNVFLHNNNYHRIHSPVDGVIRSIEHIKGDLVLLRPWVYQHDPSLPAMRNERVNLTIEDRQDRLWYLSIVGGPAVGSIVLNENTYIGAETSTLEELGLFLLGSTCCMAAPETSDFKVGQKIFVGDSY